MRVASRELGGRDGCRSLGHAAGQEARDQRGCSRRHRRCPRRVARLRRRPAGRRRVPGGYRRRRRDRVAVRNRAGRPGATPAGRRSSHLSVLPCIWMRSTPWKPDGESVSAFPRTRCRTNRCCESCCSRWPRGPTPTGPLVASDPGFFSPGDYEDLLHRDRNFAYRVAADSVQLTVGALAQLAESPTNVPNTYLTVLSGTRLGTRLADALRDLAGDPDTNSSVQREAAQALSILGALEPPHRSSSTS